LVLAHFFENGRWASPVETAVEGESLTAEDQLFILMQAASYLTATRKWHLGETASCQAAIAEAISIAKQGDDMNALALALYWAARFAAEERNPAQVNRFASDLIELSTRYNFVFWLARGVI
jgi:hypothetical protein